MNIYTHYPSDKLFSFRELFKLVIDDPELKQVISYLASCNIDNFIEEYNQPPEPDKDLTCIKVYQCYINENPEDSYYKVVGLNHLGDELGIDFLNLKAILDLPIIVDNTIVINNIKYMFKINFINVLAALFYEISFFGSPAERDNVFNSIVEDIKYLK